MAYQNDSAYAQELLDRFKPLIKKYINILKYNIIDYNNKNVIKFLSLFLSDEEERNRLHTRSLTPEDSEHIRRIMSAVGKNMRIITAKDLEHDFYVVILEMAKRYRDTGKNFLTYVANSFHYEVFRAIRKYSTADAFFIYSDPEDSDVIDSMVGYEGKNETSDSALDAAVNTAEWVSGMFADAPFDQLTPQERLLIVRRFVEKHTLKQIAEETGFSISGISKKIANIKKKLKVVLEGFE